MDAQQAFTHFIQKTLSPEKARRFTELAASKKGQRKILQSLNQFGSAIRPDAIRTRDYNHIGDSPCYVFYEPLGFGVEFATVWDAYDRLSIKDGWLILLRNASAGIHRPEARWDEETLIVA